MEDPIGRELIGRVRDLIVYDDGQGPALYAAGDMVRTGDRTLNYVARWLGLGQGWIGLDGPGGIGLSESARALGVYDEGNGPAMYAGGLYTTAGGMTTNSIARWQCGMGCRADFDGDGVLTIFDFLAFQNAFDTGSSAADFDGDGMLTIFDFLAFQNEFSAGCP